VIEDVPVIDFGAAKDVPVIDEVPVIDFGAVKRYQ
jgi:hypothetical protein